MKHFMLDGFGGLMSRFDDLRLVQEVLEDVPTRLGLAATMPPFLLPYYDGLDAADAGISAFVFIAGGHVTLHTLSRRGAYFADLVAPVDFDPDDVKRILDAAFPCETRAAWCVPRAPLPLKHEDADVEVDFGPHLMLDVEDYVGARSLDGLFTLFDRLPARIGMTPIMRPYVIRSRAGRTGQVVSAMTMLSESHVSLHVFEDSGRAYFDVFSCRFFDLTVVLPELRSMLAGKEVANGFVPRGRFYRRQRVEPRDRVSRARSWLPAVL